MDREYFQHAIQEATISLAAVTTNVIGCATTGVFVLYLLLRLNQLWNSWMGSLIINGLQ
jgi:hypothetical protein